MFEVLYSVQIAFHKPPLHIVPLHEAGEGALCTDEKARPWEAQQGHAARTHSTDASALKPISFPDSFLGNTGSV